MLEVPIEIAGKALGMAAKVAQKAAVATGQAVRAAIEVTGNVAQQVQGAIARTASGLVGVAKGVSPAEPTVAGPEAAPNSTQGPGAAGDGVFQAESTGSEGRSSRKHQQGQGGREDRTQRDREVSAARWFSALHVVGMGLDGLAVAHVVRSFSDSRLAQAFQARHPQLLLIESVGQSPPSYGERVMLGEVDPIG